MSFIGDMPLGAVVAVFGAAALAIALSGVRMSTIADRLADRTGLGEAVVGALLLGMSTSLSGTVTSIAAAAHGQASLAFANGVGGIAAQTVFLVVADMTYRRVNIEHAGADVRHMVQASLLILMLALPLGAVLLPEYDAWGVHPVSILLFGVYWLGAQMTLKVSRQKTWQPEHTSDTRQDAPGEDSDRMSKRRMIAEFAGLAAVLALAGYAIAESGAALSERIGISQTVVGALLTATATSLPELVTTLAAVRRGALQLAIAGIVGGNSFDVLFLSLSDIFYRDGSIYHAVGDRDLLLLVVAIIMTTILMIGLVLRDRRAIGSEGIAILVVYAALVALQLGLG